MSVEASGPRIARVHALAESVAPAREAFRRRWPEAICFDLLDTSLAVDDGALDALKRGNADLHDDCVLRAAERLGDVDAILRGQFSLASARTRVAANMNAPVVATPYSGVGALRRLVPAPRF
jgi:hypothetical protein